MDLGPRQVREMEWARAGARAPTLAPSCRSFFFISFSNLALPLSTAAPPIPGATPIPTGRIELITGPMFAGKSTELLRRVAAHEVRREMDGWMDGWMERG